MEENALTAMGMVIGILLGLFGPIGVLVALVLGLGYFLMDTKSNGRIASVVALGGVLGWIFGLIVAMILASL